jgi:hypothetical protein
MPGIEGATDAARLVSGTHEERPLTPSCLLPRRTATLRTFRGPYMTGANAEQIPQPAPLQEQSPNILFSIFAPKGPCEQVGLEPDQLASRDIGNRIIVRRDFSALPAVEEPHRVEQSPQVTYAQTVSGRTKSLGAPPQTPIPAGAIAGWGVCTHWRAPPLHGAHPQPTPYVPAHCGARR